MVYFLSKSNSVIFGSKFSTASRTFDGENFNINVGDY